MILLEINLQLIIPNFSSAALLVAASLLLATVVSITSCNVLHSLWLHYFYYEEKTFPPPTFLSPFFSRGARGPLFIGCQGNKLNSFARYHYTSIVA